MNIDSISHHSPRTFNSAGGGQTRYATKAVILLILN